jgi:hypothetical protein
VCMHRFVKLASYVDRLKLIITLSVCVAHLNERCHQLLSTTHIRKMNETQKIDRSSSGLACGSSPSGIDNSVVHVRQTTVASLTLLLESVIRRKSNIFLADNPSND